MRVRYEFAGTNPEAKGLCVYLEVKVAGTARVQEIVIPWSEFDNTKVLYHIDHAVRTRLSKVWSNPETPDTAYLPWD